MLEPAPLVVECRLRLKIMGLRVEACVELHLTGDCRRFESAATATTSQ